MNRSTCIFKLLLLIFINDVMASQLLPLTENDKAKIEALGKLVELEETMEHMKNDVTLQKFLVVNDFQLDKALTHFRENLKWRKENEIDSILDNYHETEMDELFPYYVGADKAGRPLIFFNLADWHISGLAEKGGLDNLSRHFYKIFEEANRKVWELRVNGSNIEQYQVVLDMDGWSLDKHVCVYCLPFYRLVAESSERNFPAASRESVFINVPSLFQTTLSFVQMFLSDRTKNSIRVYGNDKDEWYQALLEFIDQDQIPRNFLYK